MTFRNLCRYLFLLFICALPASSAIANTIPFSTGDWVISGSASLAGQSSFRLTPDLSSKEGTVMYAAGICAKEYRIDFELNVGNNIAPQGGGGIALALFDAKGLIQHRAHVDTYLHVSEDQRYELDGNHVSVESLGAYYDIYGNPPTAGNTTFGPMSAGRMPFTMEGAGWFLGSLHVKGNQVTVTFDDGTSGLVLKANVPYQPGALIFPAFVGKTDPHNRNEQQVRNISINLIDRSDCFDYEPPLTLDEARSALSAACGEVNTCPPADPYLACAEKWTQEQIAAEQIDTFKAQLLMTEANNGLAYCSGYNKCISDINPEELKKQSYDSGYQAGLSSGHDSGYSEGYSAGKTDGYKSGYSEGETAGKEAGYQTGYAAGDTEGYNRGYAEGLSAGKTQGYTSGHDAGYQEGYSAGQTAGYDSGYEQGQSAGYSAGQQAGYQSGKSEGYATGYSDGYGAGVTDGKASVVCEKYLSFDEALSWLRGECGCDKVKNSGQQTACTITNLHKMRRAGLIAPEIERRLFRENTAVRCPTSSKKR